jgi:hypothetical protein
MQAWAGSSRRPQGIVRSSSLSIQAQSGRWAAGITCGPDVVIIEPQGYRTLALQLHAAAVLTDSGGIQREAAWLRCRARPPDLDGVGRGDGGSGGRMRLVGTVRGWR